MAAPAGVGSKTELLQVLGDVKARVQDKLGIVDFPMPQFILIGKQSVGKSRLIEALAGEVFNFCSGTLGSRRPTMLEMQHTTSDTPRWYVRNASGSWEQHTVNEVMKIVGKAHEELGMSVSSDPVYVRIESPNCVDVSIVDLPGFRDFALNDDAKNLADQIQSLVMTFMQNKQNTMLCVEQASDAATMQTLARCKTVDPDFDRTILIRNKLDKYYQDLTPENVNQWVDGMGDLPSNLQRFALTLPFWQDGQEAPKDFANMTKVKSDEDCVHCQKLGIDAKAVKTIGFVNFAAYMEVKIQDLFVKAIDPVLKELEGMKVTKGKESKSLAEEYEETDPNSVANTTRNCGKSFAAAIRDVMEGQLQSTSGRRTLEEDLRSFHKFHTESKSDNFEMLPCDEFSGLDEYIQYLTQEAGLHEMGVSGGAQWRRIIQEVEIFLRFSEIAVETKKKDVIQARGVSMTSLTWRDVVVKLLGNEAHVPLQRRVRYVGERVKWFFVSHKEAILDFMIGVEDSRMGGFYPRDMPRHGRMMRQNSMIKHMVFEAYDTACERQLQNFIDLFNNMLTSTFSNPWVFLKGATAGRSVDGTIPNGIDTKDRIPLEIQSRSGIDTLLNKWLQDIPTEAHQIDEAVDKVQQLVLKTYSFIRSQVCDQVELFSESFFKIPMLRRLEEDMNSIALSADDKTKYEERRSRLLGKTEVAKESLTTIEWCIDRLQSFKLKTEARSR